MKEKRFRDYGMLFWCCLAFGLVLLIWPDLSTRVVCYALGGILGVLGILRVGSYFFRDNYLGLLRQDLTMGLLSLGGGVFLMIWPETVASFLPVVFGLLLVIAGANRLQAALDLRRMGSGCWVPTLAAALVSIVLGAVALLNPFGTALMLVRFLGISLVLVGGIGIWSSFLITRRVKFFYSDRFNGTIEVEAKEVPRGPDSQ